MIFQKIEFLFFFLKSVLLKKMQLDNEKIKMSLIETFDFNAKTIFKKLKYIYEDDDSEDNSGKYIKKYYKHFWKKIIKILSSTIKKIFQESSIGPSKLALLIYDTIIDLLRKNKKGSKILNLVPDLKKISIKVTTKFILKIKIIKPKEVSINNLDLLRQINELKNTIHDLSSKVSKPSEECRLCTDTLNNIFNLTCGDYFCKDCVAAHIKNAIEYSIIAIKCPGSECNYILSINEIKNAIDGDLFARYLNLCRIFNKKNIEKEKDEKKEKKPKKYSVKSCPHCGEAVEKRSGCNDIKCSCGKRFNYGDAKKKYI